MQVRFTHEVWIALFAIVLIGPVNQAGAANLAEGITFQSAQSNTLLIGYLFKPVTKAPDHVPAVVMMHGRDGLYAKGAKGIYDARTLLQRYRMWGRFWAEKGYIALLVDGFAPRGYPQGFPFGSYKYRPNELSEVTIRPLDAHGALSYLRSQPDIAGGVIGLQGWSNGGSTALAAMSTDAPGIKAPTSSTGFHAALVFYPGCGLKDRFNDVYRPYAPVRLFQGKADEEVSPSRCRGLVQKSQAQGGDIEIQFYEGATHGFDVPDQRRRMKPNLIANEDALTRSARFFATQLQRKLN